MFTDMVGYTALGQRNESLSLALVEEQRRLIRPVLTKHGGREVKTIGDAFLVEFPNVVDAVRCAYDIQRAIREFNLTLEPEKRIHLRVGIHVGEIVESYGDISGDAVNVASRIEPVAEDGGVCLSRQAYDHIKNKVDFALTSIGPKSLKNVAEPVEIYKLLMPWEEVRVSKPDELDRKRIAILPFTNISPDPRDEYFADGLTEELISTMSKISGLKVIARTSVMAYKGAQRKANDIAQELGVGTILEGSVRKAGDRLRITVQLIDARSSNHLWAESYDRNLKDVFEIQTDISETVAESLKVKLLSLDRSQIVGRQTASPEAFSLYMKGRVHWNDRTEEEVNRAIKFFEEALARDPQYALALVGLADCYSILGVYGYRRPNVVFPRAKELALQALSLDDNLAEAHAALSETMTHYFYEWEKAESELKKALALNPNYSQAHSWFGACLLAARGMLDEALEENKKAEELDPKSAIIGSEVARVLYLSRRYDEALEQYRKVLGIDPNFALAHKGLADVYSQKSMFTEALSEIEKAVELSKGSVFILDDAGYVYAISGRKELAMRTLSQLEHLSTEMYVPEYGRAVIYVGLGDKEKAIEWLWKAYEQRCFLTWLKVEPIFDSLHNESRFMTLLAKLGLGN
jgi:adenylate cyclase